MSAETSKIEPADGAAAAVSGSGDDGVAVLRRLRRLKAAYSLFRVVALCAVFFSFNRLVYEMCGLIHLKFPLNTIRIYHMVVLPYIYLLAAWRFKCGDVLDRLFPLPWGFTQMAFPAALEAGGQVGWRRAMVALVGIWCYLLPGMAAAVAYHVTHIEAFFVVAAMLTVPGALMALPLPCMPGREIWLVLAGNDGFLWKATATAIGLAALWYVVGRFSWYHYSFTGAVLVLGVLELLLDSVPDAIFAATRRRAAPEWRVRASAPKLTPEVAAEIAAALDADGAWGRRGIAGRLSLAAAVGRAWRTANQVKATPGQILGLTTLYLGIFPAPIIAAYLLYF